MGNFVCLCTKCSAWSNNNNLSDTLLCSCLIFQISASELERLMVRLPNMFKQEFSGVGATLEKRWKFCGFEALKTVWLAEQHARTLRLLDLWRTDPESATRSRDSQTQTTGSTPRTASDPMAAALQRKWESTCGAASDVFTWKSSFQTSVPIA